MIPNPFPGKFFVFEGMDGNGKTVQLRKVATWLRTVGGRSRAYVVRLAKEPGKERFWGAKIYEDLAKPDGLHATDPYGFQSWYACDSKDHMEKETVRDLEVGNIVLSDRYRHSMVFGVPAGIQTLEGREEAIEKLMLLNQAIVGEDFIWPDAAFIFDVSVETALSRLKKKFEEQGRGTFDGHERQLVLERVRLSYLFFARKHPNCHVIDAEGDPGTVFEKVREIMLPILA